MFAALTIVLSILSGAAGIGGFAFDHLKPSPEIVAGKMRAACANHFKSFNPGTGLWIDFHGQYHYCPVR